jgi:HEPN domain-containing protein
MSDEKQRLENEWLQHSKDDLESSRIIFRESDNYHIAAYHAHQATEKLFKWFLLKNGRKFPFIHDLKELFRLVCRTEKLDDLFEDVSFIDDLYPQLRYPTGEQVTRDEAKKSLAIAEKIFNVITGQKINSGNT